MRFNHLPAKPIMGALALVFFALLAGGALFSLSIEAIYSHSDVLAAFDVYLWHVACFTLWQALLSTILSVGLAIPVVRALTSQSNFLGRALILRCFALPQALPALVSVLGITSIYGHNGLIAHCFALFNLGAPPNIYGLTGILLAHIFFNLPLAIRLILTGYASIPNDYWKLSTQLGMKNWARFRFIEWPVIVRTLPNIAGLIFMLCMTSFTIVLTLGGGPRATTLEVAIYQALHFDFNIGHAVALTLTQLVLTFIILLIFQFIGRSTEEGFSLITHTYHFDKVRTGEKTVHFFVISVALLFVALPVGGIIISGFSAHLNTLMHERIVWESIVTSLILGSIAALLSVSLSMMLIIARETVSFKHKQDKIKCFFEWTLDRSAHFILIVPPIVIGTGWFILLRHFTDPFRCAGVMVVTVNAAMAMPFCVHLLRPAWDTASARYNKLCKELNIKGWMRLRLIDWPHLHRPLSAAFAFAMALSLGDLGIIALFGNNSLQTLPYLLLQRMGSYRTSDAAGLALILCLLCLGFMCLADQSVRPMKREEKTL